MTDLVKRLRIKAGAIEMGERIAWGSDSALMREAADALELAAPAVQGEPVECSVCRGKGYRLAPYDIVLTCPHCQGSGECPAPQPTEQQPDVAQLVEGGKV